MVRAVSDTVKRLNLTGPPINILNTGSLQIEPYSTQVESESGDTTFSFFTSKGQ